MWWEPTWRQASRWQAAWWQASRWQASRGHLHEAGLGHRLRQRADPLDAADELVPSTTPQRRRQASQHARSEREAEQRVERPVASRGIIAGIDGDDSDHEGAERPLVDHPLQLVLRRI